MSYEGPMYPHPAPFADRMNEAIRGIADPILATAAAFKLLGEYLPRPKKRGVIIPLTAHVLIDASPPALRDCLCARGLRIPNEVELRVDDDFSADRLLVRLRTATGSPAWLPIVNEGECYQEMPLDEAIRLSRGERAAALPATADEAFPHAVPGGAGTWPRWPVLVEGPVEDIFCVFVNGKHACDAGVRRGDDKCPMRRRLGADARTSPQIDATHRAALDAPAREPYVEPPAAPPGARTYADVATKGPFDLVVSGRDMAGAYRYCVGCHEYVERGRITYRHGPGCAVAIVRGEERRSR